MGKWVEEIRRKLEEWAQSIEDSLSPPPEPVPVPVRVPGQPGPRVGRGTPYPSERR